MPTDVLFGLLNFYTHYQRATIVGRTHNPNTFFSIHIILIREQIPAVRAKYNEKASNNDLNSLEPHSYATFVQNSDFGFFGGGEEKGGKGTESDGP